MTFREIFADVARWTDKAVDQPDPETRARLNGWINSRYRQLLRQPGVIQTRDETFTITTEANRARYVLPVAARSIVSVMDLARRVNLVQRSLAWIRQRDPSIPAQVIGSPWVYALLNVGGPGQQPTIVTASALEVVSTNAADTGTLEIEYQSADGGFRVLTVTMNGATPVTITLQVTQVFRATYYEVAQGTITIRQVADLREIMVLPPVTNVAAVGNPHSSRAWVIHFWPTPNGIFNYAIDGPRARATLVEDQDEPAVDEEFHDLIVWGAAADEFKKMDDDRAGDFEKRWKDGILAYRAHLHQARGQILIPGGYDRRVGWTPMGSNFPAWQ